MRDSMIRGPTARGRPARTRGSILRGGGHGGHGEAWQLIVKHRDGSLEEAVASIRWRNLAISAGILALLAVTTGMMMVTTQRAQKLAQQQIEFVAAVSHELHTPLTAMRSAGQNLADGVVADPAQVKRYGALIESEGRRLSGHGGAGARLRRHPVGAAGATPCSPTEVAAVGRRRPPATAAGCSRSGGREVERDIPADLPPVQADRGGACAGRCAT